MHLPPDVSGDCGVLANPFALSFSPVGSPREIEKEKSRKMDRKVEMLALKETGVRGSQKHIKHQALIQKPKHFGRPGSSPGRLHEISHEMGPTARRSAILRDNDK